MSWSSCAPVVLAFAALAKFSPYRMRRLMGFWDPWADPYGDGFQLTQSLIAIGTGEWTGLGLGGSVQKLFYLPEAHTDFIFAVIAEEFGLLGSLVMIALYGVLDLAGAGHCPGGRRARCHVPGLRRLRPRHLARHPGRDQPRREHGRAAHQGPHAAAGQLRPQFA